VAKSSTRFFVWAYLRFVCLGVLQKAFSFDW
jgi:hypothetical protein